MSNEWKNIFGYHLVFVKSLINLCTKHIPKNSNFDNFYTFTSMVLKWPNKNSDLRNHEITVFSCMKNTCSIVQSFRVKTSIIADHDNCFTTLLNTFITYKLLDAYKHTLAMQYGFFSCLDGCGSPGFSGVSGKVTQSVKPEDVEVFKHK